MRRLECLNLDGDITDIEPATILQLVGGLEALTNVYLPNNLPHTPGLYLSLTRARPTLKYITFGDSDDNSEDLDDACVAALCENLALERLVIDENSTLTPSFVDIILASQSAQTLFDVCFYHVGALTSTNALRLVRGCPKLTDLCWYARGLTPLTDGNGENIDDLEELLGSRGEQISRNTYFEIEVFPTYGPWKRNSHQYRTSHGQHPPGFQ